MGQVKMDGRNMSANFIKDFKELDLPLHGVRLPEFKIEAKLKKEVKVDTKADNYTFLKALVRNGFHKHKKEIDSELYEKYRERAHYELKTLNDLGFVDYVLLVWDVVNFCKNNNIPTGLGRGSAAGSLVLFLIGATGIDPVRYELYFERFVSKIRAKKNVVDGVTYLDGSLMCDVDIDVCYYNRQKVLDYLQNKFKDKTSKILTLNSLNTKLLIKECGKIIGEKSEQEMNLVSASIPKDHGIVKDIEEAYADSDDFRSWCDKNKHIYDTALKLRGLTKNKGVHPSAIALSYESLNDNCPSELDSSKNSVASFDMNWVSLSNVKLDILGLRSVSVVDDACKSIGIKLTDIDLNDEFIYQQLQNLTTPHGLFQIEADTNFRVCRKVKPRNLEELSAVLALARPGALAFVEQYANYTNNDTYDVIHPFFDDILSSTGGVALYQEQLMKMAHKIGFSLDEAEILRRIVGKKKVTEVRKWKKKIREKIKQSGLDKEIGDVLWKVLDDSANYSFNKSHSLAYAALSAATIYLKFKYPKEFYLSLLKMTRFEPEPISEISKIQKELRHFDMELLPPHLIKSSLDFSIEKNNIRFGLLSIKGISEKSIDKLNNFKNIFSNKFEIFECASEAGLNIGILCALIQAGALEGFKQSRTKVVYEAQLWNTLTKREKVMCLKVGKKHDFDLVLIVKKLCGSKNEKGKLFIKETRMGTIKKKCQKYKEIYEQNKKSESFANWYYEKVLLGYTHGKTLIDIFSEKRNGLLSVSEINGRGLRNNVIFVAQIEDKPISSVARNEKKTRYFKVNVSDETGTINVLLFNDKINECRHLNSGNLPREKEIVIIKGRKMEDAVFADLISVQNNKVYTKLSELKKGEQKKA
ncbi:hypothetical protein CL622_09040 [archaeon]|nr:hypothetical protein [archaeon]